jgi:hypothetical protein
MTGDLERFATRFLEVLDRLGREAAARYLGGLAEWCGSDLAGGLFLLPPALWDRVDALAAELEAACAAALAGDRDDPAWALAAARVRAAAAAAAALRREVEEAGRRPTG